MLTGPTAGSPTDISPAEKPYSIWIIWLTLSAALFCLLALCYTSFWLGRVRASARARRRARAAVGEIPTGALRRPPTPGPGEDVLLGLQYALASARLGRTGAAHLYYMQVLSQLVPHQGSSVVAGGVDAPKDEARRRQDDGKPPTYDEACSEACLCRLGVLLRFRARLGPQHRPLSPRSPLCGCVACVVPVMPPTEAASVQPPSYEEYMSAHRHAHRHGGLRDRPALDPLSSANFCVRADRIFGTNVGRLLQGSDEDLASGTCLDATAGPV